MARASPTRSPPGDLVLTPALRRRLKRPLGRLYPSVEVRGDDFLSRLANASLIVTVGDRVTETIQEAAGRSPDVFVVDGMERRAKREIPRIAHGATIKTRNPAGGITKAALVAMKRAFKSEKPVMVLVDGEEDLLTIPAVIGAPIGAVVFYGQPLQGVVAVQVDEKSKARAKDVMQRMSTSPPPRSR